MSLKVVHSFTFYIEPNSACIYRYNTRATLCMYYVYLHIFYILVYFSWVFFFKTEHFFVLCHMFVHLNASYVDFQAMAE